MRNWELHHEAKKTQNGGSMLTRFFQSDISCHFFVFFRVFFFVLWLCQFQARSSPPRAYDAGSKKNFWDHFLVELRNQARLLQCNFCGAHGGSIQISINLSKKFLRISCIRKITVTWNLARVFAYLPSFFSRKRVGKMNGGSEIIMAHGSSNSCGVAILVKKDVDCTIHSKILDPLGRYVILKAEINDKTHVFINFISLCSQQRHKYH